MKIKEIVATFIFCGLVVNNHAQTASDTVYEKLDGYKIGGEGGWDYLAMDSKRHYLFVTRGSHVQVVDTTTGKMVGDITPLDGVHGVAIADDLKRGYASNGRGNSVTAFDLESFKIIETVPITGTDPDAILYEPTQKQIYSMNTKSGTITVLDAVTLKVVNTIAAAEGLEFAVTDKGRVFINGSKTKTIFVIDIKSGKVEAQWPLGDCDNASGLAIDRVNDRLFSVCGNKKMVVTDSTNGKHVAEIPIGARPDAAAFDAKLGLVFSSNGEGNVTVVKQDDADHYHVAQTLETVSGARTMTIDLDTHRLYFSSAEYGPVPAAKPEDTRPPRAPMLPDSYTVFVAAPKLGK